ncbi:MAG: aminotransferase class I/II-fold pyridoxal phosphate-dependent enzyme, partial [Gemmatimonadetes bacterium]|nr:aminotransferase class I/II-fold pyridoxal phosphate-dependent enzyme [Gemmatimonadota bacterium]
MTLPSSSRLERLPGYPLADVPRLRRELRAAGVDVIDLGAGDADLAPPPVAVEALQAAVTVPGMSRYPFQLGLPAFRESVAAFMKRRFGVEVDPSEELLPLIGSKEGIAHLAFALLDPGDVAVLPDPGYQAYRGGVVLAGAQHHTVPLRPENDFLIPLGDLTADVRDRMRMLVLNYPNNPTTAEAPAAYFEEAIAFCRERGAALVHDHAYSEVAFDGYRPPSALQVPGGRDGVIEFHSMSKTFNMTGWRLGWAVGDRRLIGALSRVKTFVDTGVFLAVQAAGAAALDQGEEWVHDNVAIFQQRRDRAVSALRDAGFDVSVPRATMYLWIPVPGGEPSEDFARRALTEEGVVVLPGASLGPGGEGFFRIALTSEPERLAEAARRLGRVA